MHACKHRHARTEAEIEYLNQHTPIHSWFRRIPKIDAIQDLCLQGYGHAFRCGYCANCPDREDCEEHDALMHEGR